MNIVEIILTVFGFIVTAVGSVKFIVGKIGKFIDEAEDVVSASASAAAESAEALSALVDALKPDDSGAVSVTPEEWTRIKKEFDDVMLKVKLVPAEAMEAWNALKDIFKKNKS
jgi:hypothetical protein